MKKCMLLAVWLFIASTQTVLWGQQAAMYFVHLNENEVIKTDTLVIKLVGNNKILFIGDGFKNMMKYAKADSLKTLFINDLEAARANKTLAIDAQKVFYFVNESGKRRIKAENAEYNNNSVDVGYEIKRLQLDLPKYEYHIYDLISGYRIEIYLSDPQELKNILGSISLNEAINYTYKNAGDELKRSYKINLNADNGYTIASKTRGHADAIELAPSFGVGLLGNTFAPIVGFDLWLRLTDKYSVAKYKMGLGLTAFPFANTNQGEITGISLVNSYEGRFAFNLYAQNRGKTTWLGLQAGLMKSNDIKTFDNAFKFGFLYEGNGTFNYSFDIIKGKDLYIYGLTIKMPF
ncbi:MAG: hypothetical protein V4538_01005 [Bacteroidota bacterium]